MGRVSIFGGLGHSKTTRFGREGTHHATGLKKTLVEYHSWTCKPRAIWGRPCLCFDGRTDTEGSGGVQIRPPPPPCLKRGHFGAGLTAPKYQKHMRFCSKIVQQTSASHEKHKAGAARHRLGVL